MALEQTNINIEKLKEKLKVRYPNYDFDKAAPLDRKCKLVVEGLQCPKQNERPVVIDTQNNEMCVFLFKQIDEKTYYKSDVRCNAIITTAEERKYSGGKQDEIPF
tara:strand:+ start:77 stop:391 length:315 start_codon:yes stop_codon:yes gene_type:complete